MKKYVFERLAKKGFILEEQIESYEYGLDVLILNIIPIIIIVFISGLVDQLEYGLLFLILFIPIRVNIGGYHCKKIQNCIAVFSILFSVFLALANISLQSTFEVLGIICIFILYILEPITYDTIENEKINFIKAKKRIKKCCILIILTILMLGKNYSLIGMYMACILNVLLYSIGYIELKKRDVRI